MNSQSTQLSEKSKLLSPQQIASHNSRNNIPVDDAVTIALKQFCFHVMGVALLWLLAFLLVMIQIITEDHFTKYNIFYFIPMWLGSIYGIISGILVTKNIASASSNLVSRDQRPFLHLQRSNLGSNYIDYESLPLLRMILFWVFLSILSLILIAISQVSITYNHAIFNESRGLLLGTDLSLDC